MAGMTDTPPPPIPMSPSWHPGIPWMEGYVAFTVLVLVFEQYLNYRQLKTYWRKERPQSVEQFISHEHFLHTNAYNAAKMKFSMVSDIFSTALTVFLTVTFVFPAIWRWSGSVLGSTNEYYQSLAYVAVSMLITEVVSLPFGLYFDFVIEETYGFNKKTLGLFVKDTMITHAINVAIGAPLLCAVIWVVKWGGESMHIWLWIFSVVVSFVMMLVYPELIAPLFNKFEPLKNAELKVKIEALAQSLKFPLAKLYQIDNSKRSAHSNAYMYGVWWAKQIVLYDTLLNLSDEKILAILGHELGHWKLRHTVKMMVISFSHIFGVFYLYGLVKNNESLFASFGYESTGAVVIGFTLFLNIYQPASAVFGMIMRSFTRHHEYEADKFSYNLGYYAALREGLIHIHKDNKSSVLPDPWYSWYHYDHPPLLERLSALDMLEEEKKKAK